MIIIKSIGAFFARIWRWIKETAWVQPLLIVGAVFAVIFSIPSLTSWINSMASSGDGSFYSDARRAKTLEGETRWAAEDSDDPYFSVADSMTDLLAAAINETDNEAAVAAVKEEFGTKFFLLYVGENCEACLNDEGGFETLYDNWKTNFIPTDGRDLNIYTIDSDEISNNDEDYEKTPYDTAFKRYLDNWADDFFEPLGSYLYETTPYRVNASIEDSEYTWFSNAEVQGDSIFSTPVTILFDFSDEAIAEERVAEAVFTSLTGDGNYEKADFLLKMWNHLDSDIQNIFSNDYRTSSN